MAQPGTARAWKARGDSSPQEFKSPPRRKFTSKYETIYPISVKNKKEELGF